MQPPRISPDVACVGKTLRNQEAIQRKRQPPDAAEYADGREERQPCVVNEHTKKRHQTQNKRRQRVIPSLAHARHDRQDDAGLSGFFLRDRVSLAEKDIAKISYSNREIVSMFGYTAE